MINKQNIINTVERLIENAKSSGDPNPHPSNIAHMVIEQNTRSNECTYEEAYVIACLVTVRGLGEILCEEYDEEVIAHTIGTMLKEIANDFQSMA